MRAGVFGKIGAVGRCSVCRMDGGVSSAVALFVFQSEKPHHPHSALPHWHHPRSVGSPTSPAQQYPSSPKPLLVHFSPSGWGAQLSDLVSGRGAQVGRPGGLGGRGGGGEPTGRRAFCMLADVLPPFRAHRLQLPVWRGSFGRARRRLLPHLLRRLPSSPHPCTTMP